MEPVYIKVSYEFFSMPLFFKKLKEFVGHFRIEQQPIEDSYTGIITISFYTDKVVIPEGKPRQVSLHCEWTTDDWSFKSIES